MRGRLSDAVYASGARDRRASAGARRDACWTMKSLDTDLDSLRFLGHELGHMHAQHAILVFRADIPCVRVIWQREAAVEAAVKSFHAVALLVLFFFLVLALAFDRKHSACDADLDVFAPDPRQL